MLITSLLWCYPWRTGTNWTDIIREGRQNCVIVPSIPWKRKRKTAEVAHTHIAGAFLLIPDLLHAEQQIAIAKVGLTAVRLEFKSLQWPLKERSLLGPSESCLVYGFQASIKKSLSAQPVELMIGSFWNLCRACPSMPVDKVKYYK